MNRAGGDTSRRYAPDSVPTDGWSGAEAGWECG